MAVRILYFADVREAAGLSEETLDLPPGVTTVGALRDHLCARGRSWAVFGRPDARYAVNRTLVPGDGAPIRDGDEVAVFPALSGG
ncbi:MAG: molybdopterin converting factor subunit 1 [Burkholderiales bacterium]|nr:molybdopterin converting factor subunit 1 [Burkholderiales bacterium]MCE7876714.1 molybdopterin converting factor subunit 1 [Betaproteobacteria bacterium PRO3]